LPPGLLLKGNAHPNHWAVRKRNANLKTLALLHASQLVTLAGPGRPRVGPELRELSIISDGGMLIRDWEIVAVGRSDEIEKQISPETEIVDAGGRAVLPGFVDAHAHPVFGGNRVDEFEQRSQGASYEEIAASGGGIRSTVRKTRAATEEELFHQAEKHARWFLQGGTTTVEAKSGYGLSVEDEIKILRVVARLNAKGPAEFVPTFLGAHAIPEEFRNAPEQYVALVIHEMLPRVAEEGLAENCDIFCERGYFDLAASEKILAAARHHGLGLRMHVDQLSDSGGAFLAARMKAATADHLEQTNASGIAALAEASVQPVLLPGSVYALGLARYPQARAMIDAGLAVVLATDFNPGSSPSPSMPMMLSLAATHMKMSPAEGLTAATINAAYSLNRGEKVGSLEPGKIANFSIFNCSDYRELAYYFGILQTHSVYARAQCVYRAGGTPA
jgi:imidazolonepropionase